MKTRWLLSSLLMAGLMASLSAQAADTDPCVSSPDPPPVNGASGQATTGPGLADPGPCKITTSAKKSKGGKGSNNGKGPGNGQGGNNGNGGNAGGNGQGNGNGGGNGQDDNSEESKVKQGFAIAPVDLNLQGRNHALVGLGSYIVNAQGGCVDCHTSPTYVAGGDPYKGEPKAINKARYLAGGRSFGPGVTSANLTPDPNSSLTEEQRYADFVKSMRTGVKPTGGYLQVMPWPVYQDMTDRDLKAIFEYLQAIPYVKTP